MAVSAATSWRTDLAGLEAFTISLEAKRFCALAFLFN
jgi:hypothetical protein